MTLHRSLHRPLPVGLAGHVEMHVRRVEAGGADGCLHLAALVVPDIAEDHPGALPREGLGLRRALPARPATDQRNLAVEPAHGGAIVTRGTS